MYSCWGRRSAPPEHSQQQPQRIGCESPIHKMYQATSDCARHDQTQLDDLLAGQTLTLAEDWPLTQKLLNKLTNLRAA